MRESDTVFVQCVQKIVQHCPYIGGNISGALQLQQCAATAAIAEKIYYSVLINNLM